MGLGFHKKSTKPSMHVTAMKVGTTETTMQQ